MGTKKARLPKTDRWNRGNQVLAVTRYRHNGDLIDAARQLGHLDADWLTADVTYGKGNWWTTWRPHRLLTSDLGHSGMVTADAACLPYPDTSLDVVALDPPYKLNGTDDGTGMRYGVDTYDSAEGRHDLMRRSITEAARVLKPAVKVPGENDRWTGGRLLFKCQSQVNGGGIRWQTYEMVAHAMTVGFVLVDQLDYLGGRPQPERTRKDGKPSRQQHAYMRPSSLLIFRKERT